jgi:transposase-like protein
MNIHKNARLTRQGRLLLVRRVEELGWRIAEAAKAAGISQRQGYRWLARYRSGGAAELRDRSSAPGCCRHCIAAERISEITGLRRQRMSGPVIARRWACRSRRWARSYAGSTTSGAFRTPTS